ncbi:hypothetical protein LTR51_003090 [Lithohypha guttulata]|nr:hypothetical protein LTR51_003090 [Lithohypha guttulata]
MSVTATAVANGVLPHAQDATDTIAEFGKILKLRDEIFAGNHPRLTVPTHVLRKVSPVSSSLSSAQLSVSLQQPSIQLPGLGLTQNEEHQRPKSTTAPAQPTSTASGILPVLLTKSEDLVRAETALHRQRLEKQLRDQFEQKRLDSRKRPAPAEAKPDFDISALLAKALDAVKPISLAKDQSGKEDDNDSVDENSFYSSRAPDSTPERGEQSTSSQDQDGVDGIQAEVADTSAAAVPSGPARPSPRTQPEPTIAAKPATNPFDKPRDVIRVDADDEEEEGEYSPPEADQYVVQNGNNNIRTNAPAAMDPRSRQMRRYSDLDHNGKRAASPSDPNSMRIVRNHITSPIAPQPSRVSPLTFTKDSLVSQGRQYQNGRQRERADSPSQSPENFAAKNKRRKLERKAEKRARRGIKQENISPPPFHDIQPLGSNKPQPDDRPVVIDEPPQVQEIPYVPAPTYVDTPQRLAPRQTELVPMSEPRVVSRASIRPRDGQDLRRVASLHSLRTTEQPREYTDYDPARSRAVSYMPVASPLREPPRDYASDTERPIQEVRVVRTPAPEYREVYAHGQPEIRYIPEPMPPPPRERIVVDQYGRRFREIVQESASAAPQPAPSHPMRDSVAPIPRYYDDYTPTRAASVMFEERGPPPRFEHEMPPPRVMRQVVAQPGTPMSAARETYEPTSGGRVPSAAVFERPATRQVVYADAPEEIRPPPRMASVQPQAQASYAPVQYEEVPPRQLMPRATSVRPAPPQQREGSVFVDERASVRREYLPMEQSQPSRYRVIEQPSYQPVSQMQPLPRYIDAEGREIIYAPPPQDDGGIRYVQRY